ncbi:MAG TPA: ubiquinol-cytochrome C reductase, partial [Microbacterium sp.]|nr:ubiquinol-cytochrome C reductase [Microbacterium sp.]
MAQDDHSGTDLAAADSSHEALAPTASPGTALIASDAFENPGFPPHRPRVTDEDPKKEKRAQRTVYTLFYLSILGSVWAV